MPWHDAKDEIIDGKNPPQMRDRRVTRRREEDFFWLARLGDMSEQALIVFDPHLNLEFANSLTLSLFDISETEFAALKTYDDFVEHCVGRGDFGKGTRTTLKAFAEDLKTNARLSSGKNITERQISTPSGKHLCLRQSYGRDDRMLLAMRDISERVEAEQALELALMIGSSGYGSYNFETNSWSFSGRTLIEFLGPERCDQSEDNWLQAIIHPDDWANSQNAWKNCLKNQEDIDIKLRFVGPSGRSKWFRCYGVPKISEENRITSVLIYYVDITDEIKLQHEQLKSISKVQATLKARNDFLARLSHEVRTPMNAVIGISDALIHHNSNPEIVPKLELIQTSAEKIIRIVDETLDHSKMEEDKMSLDPTLTDPAKCVDTVCRLWQEKAASSNVTLTCRIDEDLPAEIMMDGYRYEQCINNLISNAVKFTSGGVVNVFLTKVKKASGSQLILAVKDNGIGMTPNQQKEIFMPYTQADNSISRRYGGTGLGMSITKNIIELMGGKISVKSTEGQGSLFVLAIPFETKQDIVSLNKQTIVQKAPTVIRNSIQNKNVQALKKEPVSKRPVVKPQNNASNSLVGDILQDVKKKETPYSHLRVLVVDDNETNHLVVKSLLDTVVGQIITASDGQQAIDSLEVETVDLVLMDIHMPVMDGIEATIAIRGSDRPYSNIPIIALTADPQYQQKRLCKNIGMDEALAKPVKLTELLKAFDSIRDSLPSNNQESIQRSA